MKLTGYKSIAVYLSGRMGDISIRSVRRYKAEHGLPVTEEWNGRVLADSDELDKWLEKQRRVAKQQ